MGLGHLFERRLEVFDMMASSARCSVRQLVALCRGVELGVADAPLPDLDEWLREEAAACQTLPDGLFVQAMANLDVSVSKHLPPGLASFTGFCGLNLGSMCNNLIT